VKYVALPPILLEKPYPGGRPAADNVTEQPAGNKAYADRLARDDPHRPPTAHSIIEFERARSGMTGCRDSPKQSRAHGPSGRSAPSSMSTRKLDSRRPAKFGTMKKVFELLVCFLHPIAVVLMWLDLATRTDIARGSKLAWAIFGLIPFVPFLYVLTGGELW